MKKVYLLLSMFFLLLFFITTPAQTKEIDKTFPLQKNGVVEIDNYKGSITVQTWDKSEVKVHVKIEPDGWGRDEEKKVEATEIIFSESNDKVSMKTEYQKKFFNFWGNNGSNPFAHYTISMPATARLEIDDYKSDIEVKELKSDIVIETYKGNVNITGLEGSIDLETYKGDVQINFKALTDDCKFDTYKGKIELTLPADSKFSVDADLGKKGDFDSEFDVNENRTKRNRDDDYVRGDINGGGSYIEFSTYKGDLRLRKK